MAPKLEHLTRNARPPYEPPKSDAPLPAREIAHRMPAVYVAGTALVLLVASLAANDLRIGDEQITSLWAPAGVILASLMFAPLRLWPALFATYVAIGVVVSHFILGSLPGLGWATYFSLPTALQSLVGAYLLKRTIGDSFAPTRVGTVVCFLAVALVVPALGGAMGALGVVQLSSKADFLTSWRMWWFGDSLGILALVPLMSALGGDLRPPPSKLSSGGRREYWALMTTLVLLGLWVFGGEATVTGFLGAGGALDAPLIVGPVLIWAALRFGPRAVSIALAVTSVLCVREAVSGRGPFVGEGAAAQDVISIQAFLAVTLSSILILQAMVQALRLTLAAMRSNRSRLDQLASRINAVMWMLDPKKQEFLYVSPAYSKIFGRPAEELEREPLDWLEAVHPEDRDRVRQVAADRYDADGGTRPVDVTFRILRGEGEVRWLWTRSFPVPPSEDDPALEVGNAIDITHQRAAEQQQNELERQLLQAQKMEAVGQLASGIAHDLNNVLTVVQGHALLLADPDETPEERAESLEALEDAVGQAHGVTSSLLTFARGLSGERHPFDLGDAVRETAGLLRRTLPASVEFEIHVPGALEYRVLGDRTQLQQVVLNLALNARDAMPEGGELHVRVGEAETHGGRGKLVRVTVSDTGTGIAEEALEHLFEPFFTTKERGRGTGLGLSVVLGIVRDHEGEIRVDSEVGKGTRFTIDLPRLEQDPAEEEDMSDDTHEPVRGAGARLLLAEDSDGIRKLLKAQLTKLGFEIDEVADGEALFERVSGDPQVHRLWVLDLDLPKRSGLSCLEEFRANGWDTPAILITGDPGAEIDKRIDERTEVVLKPFTVPELAERIRQRLLE